MKKNLNKCLLVSFENGGRINFMKKVLSILLVLGLCFGLAGCGGDSKDTDTGKKESEDYLTESEITEMYTNPNKYEGRKIKVTGKVFQEPEVDGDSIVFQMWADAINSDLNTIVYAKTDIKLSVDDYVRIDGVVGETFKGENAFGGSVTAPTIKATKIEKVEPQDLLAPTTKELTPNNLSINQNNVVFTVEKIQFSKEETRVFLKIENNSGSEFSFYSFNAKIAQDGKQYDYESNYEANYKEINSDILNGITTDGILTFPAISEKSFDLYLDGSSDNYDLDFNDYVFNIIVE